MLITEKALLDYVKENNEFDEDDKKIAAIIKFLELDEEDLENLEFDDDGIVILNDISYTVGTEDEIQSYIENALEEAYEKLNIPEEIEDYIDNDKWIEDKKNDWDCYKYYLSSDEEEHEVDIDDTTYYFYKK